MGVAINNKYIAISNCPICNSDLRKVVLSKQHARGLETQQIDTHRCLTCGHHYTSPITSLSCLDEVYSDQYYSYNYDVTATLSTRKHKFKKWIYNNFLSANPLVRLFVSLVARQLAGFPRPDATKEPQKVLDIGCGNGAFLSFMKDVGYQTYGLDLSEVAVKAANANGHECQKGSFETIRYPDNYFSLITVIHVLEHFQDPVEQLQEIHRILADEGEVIVVVPNFNSVDRYIFKECWMALLSHEHFQQFTQDSFERAASKSDFRVTRKKFIVRPYLVSNVKSFFLRNKFSYKSIVMLGRFALSLIGMLLLSPLVYLGVIEKYGVYMEFHLEKLQGSRSNV